jgi:hypothetical protein
MYLMNQCDDSEKGKFRKDILQMALRGGPLPLLLTSTLVKVPKSHERIKRIKR